MASMTMAAQAICVPSSVAVAALPQCRFSSLRIVSPLPLPAVSPLRSAVRQRTATAPRAQQPSAAQPDLATQVEKSIKEAQEKCASDEASGECVAAWDEVEELSAAAAHKKVADKESKDPLEVYCKDNPETDECRVYED